MGKQPEGGGITWTDYTWNPVRGCTKISPGCKNCYAETFAERWRGVPGHPYEQGFDLRLVPEKLDEPLRWKKPRRIFVNSMSDLFQDGVPDYFIDQVFLVMAACQKHIFQVLTKRPKRMLEYCGSPETAKRLIEYGTEIVKAVPELRMIVGSNDSNTNGIVLKNVWLGVSAENQKYFDERVELLGQIPAAVRFVSIEPMLEDIDTGNAFDDPPEDSPYGKIDWVIVGGESGPGARPMQPEWARSVRDQCVAAGVPFFFKQWGGVQKKKAGRELDGREWNGFPREVTP